MIVFYFHITQLQTHICLYKNLWSIMKSLDRNEQMFSTFSPLEIWVWMNEAILVNYSNFGYDVSIRLIKILTEDTWIDKHVMLYSTHSQPSMEYALKSVKNNKNNSRARGNDLTPIHTRIFRLSSTWATYWNSSDFRRSS